MKRAINNISIVIPVFNEEKNIINLLEELQSSLNNKIKYEYLGFEKRNDQINLYLQVKSSNVLDELSIQNKILYKSFSTQKNIVLYRHKKSRKSFIQDQNNQISSIKINR